MKSRFPLVFVVLLLTVGAGTYGLELTQGNMRVVLFENTGRFSAYFKSSAGEWTPLFYSQDPRTTVLELLVGNDLYRLGDSSRFRQNVTKTPNGGGQITFTSQKVSVTETFSFAKSANASQADGVRVSLRFTNLSSGSLSVGARYIVDTYLGEQSRIEFVTPTDGSMTNETAFSGSQVPAYWVSPKDKQKSVALEAVLRGSGVTTPNKVIFANWKRLNESNWDYTVDTTRNFNMLPYSINDSAVAMYYDPGQLAAGASRTIELLIGQYSQSGWGAAATSQPTATPAAGSSTTPNPAVTLDQANTAGQGSTSSSTGLFSQPATPATIQSDLNTVNGVLLQIQKMLASPDTVSQSDIDGLRQVLDKLNARKTRTGGQ